MNPPRPADVIAIRKAAGMTQTEAAVTVHASLRAWQAWEGKTKHARPMPMAEWELFLLKTGNTTTPA